MPRLFAQSLYTGAVNASVVTATAKALITSRLVAATALNEGDTVVVVLVSI